MPTSDTPHFALDEHVISPELVTSEVTKITNEGVGSGKTWTIEIDGEKTAAIARDATAAAVQSALEKLSNISPGDVTVTGGPFQTNPVVISFEPEGAYGRQDVATPVTTATEGTAAVTTVTAGGAETKARRRGTGDADATTRTNPLAGDTPAEQRAENGSDYGDA